MEKIGVIIQARMGSTRLPGKVLMDFCGKPMLLFQVDLLKRFNLGSEIVVATSENPLDDAIEGMCGEHDIPCIRGSEENVFQRFCLVAQRFKFDHIIRLTGDNPLTNNTILTACIRKHLASIPDVTSTRKIDSKGKIERYAPKGSSVDVINCKTLLNISSDSLSDFEKEHVIPVFFYKNFRVEYIKGSFGSMRSLSIDDIGDFERVSEYARGLLERGVLLQELGYPVEGTSL